MSPVTPPTDLQRAAARRTARTIAVVALVVYVAFFLSGVIGR